METNQGKQFSVWDAYKEQSEKGKDSEETTKLLYELGRNQKPNAEPDHLLAKHESTQEMMDSAERKLKWSLNILEQLRDTVKDLNEGNISELEQKIEALKLAEEATSVNFPFPDVSSTQKKWQSYEENGDSQLHEQQKRLKELSDKIGTDVGFSDDERKKLLEVINTSLANCEVADQRTKDMAEKKALSVSDFERVKTGVDNMKERFEFIAPQIHDLYRQIDSQLGK